ncbi:hypothetical protein D3C80_2223280 [compost metagenome]
MLKLKLLVFAGGTHRAGGEIFLVYMPAQHVEQRAFASLDHPPGSDARLEWRGLCVLLLETFALGL